MPLAHGKAEGWRYCLPLPLVNVDLIPPRQTAEWLLKNPGEKSQSLRKPCRERQEKGRSGQQGHRGT